MRDWEYKDPIFYQVPMHIYPYLRNADGRIVPNPEYVEECRKRKERFCAMEKEKKLPMQLSAKCLSELQVGEPFPVYLEKDRDNVIGKAEIVEREGGKEYLITFDMTTPGAQKALGFMNEAGDVSMRSGGTIMSKSIKKNVTIRSDDVSIERWRRVATSYKQTLNAWIVNILNAETNIEDNYERISIIMPLPKDHLLLSGAYLERERELRKPLTDAGFHMWNIVDIGGKRYLHFVKRKEQG